MLFSGYFLLIRRTWPTLLVNWHLVTSRPVIYWADSKSLYTSRIPLYLMYTNNPSLVELNICASASCICSLIYTDYLYWQQWPTLLLLFPNLLALLAILSRKFVLNQLLLSLPTLELFSLLMICCGTLSDYWCGWNSQEKLLRLLSPNCS